MNAYICVHHTSVIRTVGLHCAKTEERSPMYGGSNSNSLLNVIVDDDDEDAPLPAALASALAEFDEDADLDEIPPFANAQNKALDAQVKAKEKKLQQQTEEVPFFFHARFSTHGPMQHTVQTLMRTCWSKYDASTCIFGFTFRSMRTPSAWVS